MPRALRLTSLPLLPRPAPRAPSRSPPPAPRAPRAPRPSPRTLRPAPRASAFHPPPFHPPCTDFGFHLGPPVVRPVLRSSGAPVLRPEFWRSIPELRCFVRRGSSVPSGGSSAPSGVPVLHPRLRCSVSAPVLRPELRCCVRGLRSSVRGSDAPSGGSSALSGGSSAARGPRRGVLDFGFHPGAPVLSPELRCSVRGLGCFVRRGSSAPSGGSSAPS